MAEPTQDRDFSRIYREAETIAVIGAHPDPDKPSHYVPKYLQDQGFEVVPVNPGYVDEEILGSTPVATLADLEVDVDVVEIFRRSENVSEHVDQILAMDPRPQVVWMQQGIRNDEVAQTLRAEGIDVVQDVCMMAKHRELGLTHAGSRSEA